MKPARTDSPLKPPSAADIPPVEVVGLGASSLDVLSMVGCFPTGDAVQQAIEMTVDGGGPVATALACLARLGARTAMLDAIGDDWRSRLIVQTFQRDGVATGWLRIRAGSSAQLSSILVRQTDGARAITFSPGSAADLQPDDLPLELLSNARILHLNGRHLAACLAAARHVRACGGLVSFDGGAGRYKPAHRDLLPLCDIAILAREFACAYSGEADSDRAAARIARAGTKLVVITDGLRGSWIYPAEQAAFHQPACPVQPVVDTTGCGDAYHGAFLYGVLHGWSLLRCAALASAVAGLNVRALGGRAALPSLAEALQYLELN